MKQNVQSNWVMLIMIIFHQISREFYIITIKNGECDLGIFISQIHWGIRTILTLPEELYKITGHDW